MANRRLAVLRDLRFLDGEMESVLDYLAEIAARALHVPASTIAVINVDLLLTRGSFGLGIADLPAEAAFRAEVMANRNKITVVSDRRADTGRRAAPQAGARPAYGFLAGAPLLAPDGSAIGAMCIMDREPRDLDADERALLGILARHVELLIKLRRSRLAAAEAAADSARAEQAEYDQLRAILLSAIDLKSLIDRDYVFRYVSPSYTDYWQTSREAIVGQPMAKLVGQENFERRIKPALDRALAGEDVRYETVFVFPGKGARRLEVLYAPARDRSGAITGVVAVARDVEDLKRGEDRLAETIRELEEAQAVSRVGNWDWDPANGWVSGSREFHRLFNAGNRPFGLFDELIERVHPDDRPAFRDELRMAASGRRGYDFEFRLRLAEGGVRHLHARGRSQPDRDGAMRIAGTFQDISERKAAELALRDSLALNRATFDQAAVGIAHVGTDGSWLQVNDRLCQIVGHEREELLRLTFQDLTYPEDLHADLAFVRRVLAGEIPTFSMEKRYVRRDGSLIWINLTVSLVRDAAGAPMHFISIVEDINARKHAELELQENRRSLAGTVKELEDRTVALRRFIHILSHDMREPLNTIINFSGLLAEHPVLSEDPERRYMEYLSTGAHRMKFLIDDLLQYVRLDRAEARDAEVDLNEIVNQVCNDLAAQIGLAGATVNATPLPAVRGDPSLIRVVLQNLVSNAIKFVSPGVEPVVRLSDDSVDDTQWRIGVHDNGIGIPQGEVAKLFATFSRLNSRDRYAGNGLGLATCKRIAEMHRGTVDVTSTSGQGSCFSLVLPRPQIREGRNGGV
jgi:PAS domain S-box-containing protein